MRRAPHCRGCPRMPRSCHCRRSPTRRTHVRLRDATPTCWSTWPDCMPPPACSSRRARRGESGRWPRCRLPCAGAGRARCMRTPAELAGGLRALCERPFPEAPGARNLRAGGTPRCARISRATRLARPRDTLACWPRSPATRPRIACLAVLARDGGDHDGARSASSRAPSNSRPTTSTRALRRRNSPLAMHQTDRAAALLREGLERTPYRVELWQALGHAELARRDGAAAAWAFDQALRLAPAGGQTSLQSWRCVADGRRRRRGGAGLPARAGAAAGLRVGMLQPWRAVPAAGQGGGGDRRVPAGGGAQPARCRGIQESGRGPVRLRPGRRMARQFPRLRDELPDVACRSRCRRWR